MLQPAPTRAVRLSMRVTPVTVAVPSLVTTISKYTVVPVATETVGMKAPAVGLTRTPFAMVSPNSSVPPATTIAVSVTGPTWSLDAVAVFDVDPAETLALYVHVNDAPAASVVGATQPSATRS